MNDAANTRVHAGQARVGVIVALLVVFILVVMFINSRKPERIEGLVFDPKVKGTAFVQTNLALIDQMVDNWIPNDYFWPTIFLDNLPNFQIGELEVVRYNVRVLRDNLSRSRTTDKIDKDAEDAFTALSNDPSKWWFPSAESRWKAAGQSLGRYNQNLLDGRSTFYPRADNLVELLDQYASLMGGVNTRLIHAPRDINQVLVLDEEGKKEDKSSQTADVYVPWMKIDDNFYYAQGVAYALYESLRAIRVDFMNVLTDKNSLKFLDKALEDLGRCSFEPLIVFNGDPDSIFANHSLNLSGVFNDARQKIYSLIVALKQG